MVFYYDRISVKEGIYIERDEENYTNFPDETISKRCTGCRIVFFNSSNFKYQEQICDRCHKMLLGTTLDAKKIQAIWYNNC